MNHPLPEIASLLAVYLRQITGVQTMMARVIVSDSDDNCDPDGRDYILIGQWPAVGPEIELFNLFPPSDDLCWRLSEIVYTPQTRDEPAGTDAKEVVVTPGLSRVFCEIATHVLRERVGALYDAFEYDRECLYNGEPVRDVS